MGFVYVVSDGSISKVGMTSNPKSRIGDVSREVFGVSSGLMVFCAESKSFKQAERILISAISEKHESIQCKYKREVFDIGFDDAVSYCYMAVMLANAQAESNSIRFASSPFYHPKKRRGV